MRLVVVALMLLIAGATHAAAQQYHLFPASVAATKLQVQHHAVLVNTATGDIYTCIGTLALEKNGQGFRCTCKCLLLPYSPKPHDVALVVLLPRQMRETNGIAAQRRELPRQSAA